MSNSQKISKNSLNNFWQFRFAKVVWFALVIAIFAVGMKGILHHNFHPKYHENHRIIVNGKIYKYENNNYDLKKILIIIFETFILSGSLILITIFMQKILFYIIFNEPIFCLKNSGKSEKFEEKFSEKNSENSEEIIKLSEGEIIKK